MAIDRPTEMIELMQVVQNIRKAALKQLVYKITDSRFTLASFATKF
jgi:hypothetical protein